MFSSFAAHRWRQARHGLTNLGRGGREHETLAVASRRFDIVFDSCRGDRWHVDRIDATGNMLEIRHGIFTGSHGAPVEPCALRWLPGQDDDAQYRFVPLHHGAADRCPPRWRSMRVCRPFLAAWRDPSVPPRIHLPTIVVPCLGRWATGHPSANTSIVAARAPPESPASAHPLRTRWRWVSPPCPRQGPFQPIATGCLR